MIFATVFGFLAVCCCTLASVEPLASVERQSPSLPQDRQLQELRIKIVSLFETNTKEGWEDYSNLPTGGGGSEVVETGENGPPEGAGTYSLEVGFDSATGQLGTWGGLVNNFTEDMDDDGFDISNMDTFSFFINADDSADNSDFELDIFLGDLDDSEFYRYLCAVSVSGPCVTIGGGWQRIDIPFTDFTASGGDGVLTGPLSDIEYSINSRADTAVSFLLDNILFAGPNVPTAPPVPDATSSPTAAPVTSAPVTSAPVAAGPTPGTDAPVPPPPTLAPVEGNETTLSPVEVPPPTTASPVEAPPTESPVAAPSPTSSPVVDDGRIECPKAYNVPCTPSDLNCCLATRNGKDPVWAIEVGDKLHSGKWLCRDMYAYGILHRGTVHALRDDGDGRCTVLWTLEDGMVEGDYLEVNEEGNLGLWEVGGTGRPVWEVGCSMGDDSRLQMQLVQEEKEDPRIALLRTFKKVRRDRRALGQNKRKKKRKPKKKRPPKKRIERDWWVTRNGNEGERVC